MSQTRGSRRFAALALVGLLAGAVTALARPLPAGAAAPTPEAGKAVVDSAGGHVFVTATSQIDVYDLDGTPVGAVAGLTEASDLTLDGRTLFVADYGADRIDAIDADTLQLSGGWDLPTTTQPYSLAHYGNRIWFGYEGDGTAGVASLDVSTGSVQPVPGAPSFLWVDQVQVSQPTGRLVVVGYTSQYQGLYAWDLGYDPPAPVDPFPYRTTTVYPGSLVTDGAHFVWADENGGDLESVDTNLANRHWSDPSYVYLATRTGGRIVVALATPQIHVYDASDLTEVADLDLGTAAIGRTVALGDDDRTVYYLRGDGHLGTVHLDLGAPPVSVQPGEGAATVSWSAPTHSLALDGYVVTPYDGATALPPVAVDSSTASVTIPGLDDGHTYRFEVAASDLVGSGPAGSAEAVVGAPEAPAAPTAVGGVGSAVVSWTAPADNGSPVTGYEVTAWRDGDAEVATPAGPTDTDVTVTGLTDAATYTFTVTATNARGAGPASPPSAGVVTGLPQAPGTPATTAVTGGVALTWDPPPDDGAPPVTAYAVHIRYPDSHVSTRQFGPDPSALIDWLAGGHDYSFQVAAVNAAGQGPWSPWSDPTTVYDVPQWVWVSSIVPGDGTITLLWQPPDDDGGLPVTGYRVTMGDWGTTEPSATFDTTDTTYTLTGLTNGSSYWVAVVAVNALGAGPYLHTFGPEVPGGLPGAPTDVTASGVPDTSGTLDVTVAWQAPPDNGSPPVTAYRVYRYRNGVSYGSFLVPDAATSTVFHGMAKGVTWTFVVTAINVVEAGPASDPSPPLKIVTPPTEPRDVTVRRGSNGDDLLVTWTASADVGGEAATYVATCYLDGTPVATDYGPSPDIAFTGLTPGASYVISLVATNSGGSSDPVVTDPLAPARKPDVPTGLTAVAGDSRATLSWNAPYDWGSPITTYAIQVNKNGVPQPPSVVVPGTTTSAVVTGLSNGWPYTFTVTAQNALGSSYASAPTSTVFVAGPPPAPTITSVQSGDGSAHLVWGDVNWGGSPITGFVVTPYVGTVAQTPQLFPASPYEATVTGLTNGVSYTFTVAGVNDLGQGPESAKSLSVKVGQPGAPTDVTAVAGDASVQVAWTPPASDGGSPITGYQVFVVGGGSTVKPVFDASTTTRTISGLTNGVTYTVKVQAINAVGNSPSSSVTTATPGLPGTPTIVSAVPGDGAVQLTWTAADPNGSPITSYLVYPYIGTKQQAVRTFSSNLTTQSVGGLTNGSAYTFTVVAQSAAGKSAPSAPSSAVTPMTGPPGIPSAVTVTPGVGELTVAWTAPSPGGGPISSYTVDRYDGGSATPTATTVVPAGQLSLTTSGLSPSVTSSFRVAATNSYGTGSASPLTAPVAPLGVLPVAPDQPGVTPGAGQITVHWTPPDSGTSPLTTYTVRRYDDGASVPAATTVVPADQQSLVVTGLLAGTTYRFTVTATSTAGDGPASAASDPVSPLADALAGVVLDHETLQPVAGIRVRIFDGSALAGSAWTGPDGSWSFTGLAPGSYAVQAADPTNHAYKLVYVPDANSVDGATLFPAGSGGIVVLAPPTSPAGAVSGTAVDNRDGHPLAGIRVRVFAGGQLAGQTTTSATGAWSFTGLAAGDYAVQFADTTDHLYRLEYWQDAATLDTATTLHTGTTGATARLDLVNPATATISGRALDDVTGQPLAGIRVRLFAGDVLAAQTTTAADGTWSVGGLPAGSYGVQFADKANHAYELEYWHDATTLDTATLVTPGASGIDGRLTPVG